jgi:hypothetical protein
MAYEMRFFNSRRVSPQITVMDGYCCCSLTAKVKRGGDLCDNLSYLGQQGVLVMPK